MSLTLTTEPSVPRLRGLVEILRLSREQYERMFATGILCSGAPVEFRDGYLVTRQNGNGPRNGLSSPPALSELCPLSLEQYHQMIRAGILAPEASIELLEGHLIALDRGGGPGMPPNPEHASASDRLCRRLIRRLPERWLVRCQNPISLGAAGPGQTSYEPQPDAAVAEGPEDLYAQRHPGPLDLRMVGEVANSSLLLDRRIKTEVYARAGIPVYWIVNIPDRCLEVYSDPDVVAGQYQARQVLTEDQEVTLQWPGLDPIVFQVRELLP